MRIVLGVFATIGMLAVWPYPAAGVSPENCPLPSGWYHPTIAPQSFTTTRDSDGTVHYITETVQVPPGPSVAFSLGQVSHAIPTIYDSTSRPTRPRDFRGDLLAGAFYRTGLLNDQCSIGDTGVVFFQDDTVGPGQFPITPSPTPTAVVTAVPTPMPAPTPTPPPVRPTVIRLKTSSIDFGRIEESALRSDTKQLELEVVPGTTPGDATLSLALVSPEGGPAEAVIEPASGRAARTLDLVLVAQPGQLLGTKTGMLIIQVQGATLEGNDRVPVTYEFGEPLDWSATLPWLIPLAALALLWVGGALENRSRQYRAT